MNGSSVMNKLALPVKMGDFSIRTPSFGTDSGLKSNTKLHHTSLERGEWLTV